MKRKLEVRTLLRNANASETDGEKIVKGVIPYNVKSRRMQLEYSNCEYEVLAPSVFKKTLADKAEVYCNYAHDDLAILGNTKSNTLQLENRADGLHFTLKLDSENEIAMRAYSTIKRGDCNTLSFEFFPFDWEEKENVCTLKSAKLSAISVCVINPAYEETKIETIRERSIENVKKIIRAIENNEMDLTNPETLGEVKQLLETISNALQELETRTDDNEKPKDEVKNEVKNETKSKEKVVDENKSQKTETNSQEQGKSSKQSDDTQTDNSQVQEKDEVEDEEKQKQLEEIQKELEKELSE